MALQPQQRLPWEPIRFSNSAPSRRRVTVATAMAAIQPQEVQPFFGAHGGGLTGRQALTLDGASERLPWQTLQFRINPDGSINSPTKYPPKDAQHCRCRLALFNPETLIQLVLSLRSNPPSMRSRRLAVFCVLTFIGRERSPGAAAASGLVRARAAGCFLRQSRDICGESPAIRCGLRS